MTKRHKQRPLDTTDPADVSQILAAQYAFRNLLWYDPRVITAVDAWIESSASKMLALRILYAFERQDGDAAQHAWDSAMPSVALIFAPVIPADTQVPWVMTWLANTALTMALGIARGEPMPPVEYRLPSAMRDRRHRLPKGGIQTIMRDVSWYYRARVKNPPDSVSALAREHQGDSARSNARSVIQDAIAKSKARLGL